MSSKVLFQIFRARNVIANHSLSLKLLVSLDKKQFHASPPLKTQPQSSNPEDDDTAGEGKDTISKAMQSYMQRAKEHQEFMDKEEKEFVFGRRHLANMMGKDAETLTQSDIDEAIRYLFPSGLFEKKARPMMKPPQEIYPKQKAAQFDMSGRPHHPFFYTAAPNFFYIMHEMVGKLNKMNISSGGLFIDSSEHLALIGSMWISKGELESRLMEKLSDKQYSEWTSCMERIAQHPQREKELNFVKGYRIPIGQQTTSEALPPVSLEPDGRKSCFVPLCMMKSSRAEVKVTIPGTGRFNINGQSLDYYEKTQSREMVLTPLQVCGLLGKVDVDAYVIGGQDNMSVKYGGESAQAASVRWGIATALAALGQDADKLRLAGLLTRDNRRKERSRIGKTGARATFTWKKR